MCVPHYPEQLKALKIKGLLPSIYVFNNVGVFHFSFMFRFHKHLLSSYWSEMDRGRIVVKVLVSLEFFIGIKSFRSHYGPAVDSASNRNGYQEYFLGVKAAGA